MDNVSQNLEQALEHARTVAREFERPEMTPVHMLIGMMMVEDCGAVRVLERIDRTMKPKQVIEALRRHLGRSVPGSGGQYVPCAAGVVRAFRLAKITAAQSGRTDVSTSDVLLAIAQGEQTSVAFYVLCDQLGFDSVSLERAVIEEEHGITALSSTEERLEAYRGLFQEQLAKTLAAQKEAERQKGRASDAERKVRQLEAQMRQLQAGHKIPVGLGFR